MGGIGKLLCYSEKGEGRKGEEEKMEFDLHDLIAGADWFDPPLPPAFFPSAFSSTVKL